MQPRRLVILFVPAGYFVEEFYLPLASHLRGTCHIHLVISANYLSKETLKSLVEAHQTGLISDFTIHSGSLELRSIILNLSIELRLSPLLVLPSAVKTTELAALIEARELGIPNLIISPCALSNLPRTLKRLPRRIIESLLVGQSLLRRNIGRKHPSLFRKTVHLTHLVYRLVRRQSNEFTGLEENFGVFNEQEEKYLKASKFKGQIIRLYLPSSKRHLDANILLIAWPGPASEHSPRIGETMINLLMRRLEHYDAAPLAVRFHPRTTVSERTETLSLIRKHIGNRLITDESDSNLIDLLSRTAHIISGVSNIVRVAASFDPPIKIDCICDDDSTYVWDRAASLKGIQGIIFVKTGRSQFDLENTEVAGRDTKWEPQSISHLKDAFAMLL